ncbi:PREDICTED: lymphoid-restricted membrane protein-like [Tauraco erythrolophus]|nr:PREDICTED: lymphoid-restricted membrane protein-like [Tauraco erythrolophus]
MSSEHGVHKRHHNPVDSICRKIKSIQMRDQVPNPALQIPKFQSQNFDSPQCNIKKNLEEILKKRTFRSHDSTSPHLISASSGSVFSEDFQLLSPRFRHMSDSSSANASSSIMKSKDRSSHSWTPVCSMENSSPSYFRPREANTQNKLCALSNIEYKDVPCEQKYLTSSPDLYFFTTDKKSESTVIQSPVSKRLSFSETGRKRSLGYKADNMHDVSLICEEDLLMTIFYACDIERTGRVAVSRIVDYLRHTTSRELEDSGLEELCNMLDPDQKDVTIDLETYHAIMKEWTEDCKRKWEDGATEEPTASMEDLEFKVHKNTSEVKKTDAWMNVTSGSLEAFGGDVSKGDMETSDLITCVADLQYNNQKLQEENSELKLTLEAMDEANNKLLADNEDLRQQIKSIQHSVLKAKMLEEELEEVKHNLNLSEEKRQQILCHNKQLNIRNSMDTDGLQRKILELSKNAAELQLFEKNTLESHALADVAETVSLDRQEEAKVQAHIFETTAVNKEASLMQVLKQELGEKRHLWIQKLHLLEKYKESLDKDFIQMASNLRRTKTEQFHLKKELSARQREMETVKQLQEETAGQAEAVGLELQKAIKQLEDASKQAEDHVEAFHSACEEAASLKRKLEEAISEQQKLKDVNAALRSTCQLLQEKVEDQKRADLTKKEFRPMMEEHKTTFQNALKQDPEVHQEKKNNKERSDEASAVVPSKKGSSPTAGGIKADKTKQNEPDSPNEKEVEAEFLRLSLGFKCDLFTLDKRVRLEERSRDLAEENLKKEITNALKMLEALFPLCEEDNQAQEIIKKLQKSLQFLSQYAARVASKAEMLGAINQESRVSKAVEVMIQHVENLKRMYAKEHAELEELKQVLLQNERSFGSLGDRDESTNKKLPNSFNFKPLSSLRRVSIATLPRSAGNAGTGLPLAQLHEPDGDERSDKFNRRSSSWGRLGAKQNEKRPSLQRFISTYSWAEYEDEHSEAKNEQTESPTEAQEEPSRKESISEKGKYSSKWNLESVCSLMSSWASHFKNSFSNANKTLWVSVSILVLLAALTSFLTGLSLQRPADAAPVGTGDSWTSLQQLLWPYTGLQHNGPPPI